jgi:hypothetical protein
MAGASDTTKKLEAELPREVGLLRVGGEPLSRRLPQEVPRKTGRTMEEGRQQAVRRTRLESLERRLGPGPGRGGVSGRRWLQCLDRKSTSFPYWGVYGR